MNARFFSGMCAAATALWASDSFAQPRPAFAIAPSEQAVKAKPIATAIKLPPPAIIIAPPAKPAPPKVDPDAECEGGDVDEVVHRLADWTTQFKANERLAYLERHCAEPGVLCLNRFGDAELDTPPDAAHPGQLFTAEVIVPVIDRGKLAITTSIRGKTAVGAGPFEREPGASRAATGANAPDREACKLTAEQRESLRKAALPIAELGTQRGMDLLETPQGSSAASYWSPSGIRHPLAEWTAWIDAHAGRVPQFTALESTIEVPATEHTVNVDFSRTETSESTPSAEHHREVRIDHGQYYVEASVLVPFVVLGSRKATLTPTPSGTELRVGLNEDWHVTGALMVDLFPFGRQKGQISSFDHCRSRSCVENWLGVQLGMGLSQPLEEWYLGLELQPVSGLALGVGASMLKGQFLGPGLAEGMLLPSAANFSTTSDYMFRPYFGLALTTDILETIDRSGIFGKFQ